MIQSLSLKLRQILSLSLGLCLSLSLIFTMMSCSQMGTLNLSEHHYGNLPTKIIWIQLAGFQDEHLSMIKFLRPTSQEKTDLEKMSCLGKAWNYNLYQLRPSAFNSSLSQITGKKNIKDSCEDFSLTPIWNHLHQNGYQSAIFESEVDNETSLEKSKACPEYGKDYLKNTIVWAMRNEILKENQKTFHAQDQSVFVPGHIYYDKSCQKKGCFTSLFRNIEFVFENFQKNQSHYLFLVRDFSYFNAIRKKDMSRAKEVLLEIEKIYAYFLRYTAYDNKILILISSIAPWNLEFPQTGKEWASFEEKGAPVLYKNTSFLAPVFAKGARAENFCGIYEEAEIFERMIRTPTRSF